MRHSMRRTPSMDHMGATAGPPEGARSEAGGQTGGSMTDRELLELAAKAAGIKTPGKPPNWMHPGVQIPTDFGHLWWNPPTDDGDALRLAVKLKIEIKYYADHSIVRSHDFEGSTALGVPGRDGDHLLAATRRAIVRS